MIAVRAGGQSWGRWLEERRDYLRAESTRFPIICAQPQLEGNMRRTVLLLFILVASTLGAPAGKKSGGGKGGGGGGKDVEIVKEVITLSGDSDSSSSSSSSASSRGCCDLHCLEVGCDCSPRSADCLRQQAKMAKKKNKGDRVSKKDGKNNQPKKGGGGGKSSGGKSTRTRVHRRDLNEE